MKKKGLPKVTQNDSAVNRFRIELDLHLFFTPLMRETGDGIVLTRTLELPFPPCGEIMIGGKSIEGDCIPPLGYNLKDIVWDVDRQVFLTKTVMSHGETPLAFVPMEIEMLVEDGWRIGSWRKFYDRTWKCPISENLQASKFDLEWDDEKELYLLETTPSSRRPEQFNHMFGGIVRLLFMLRNNEAVGYAMYKSKMYFQDEKNRSPEFTKLIEEYLKMGGDDQEIVRRNVMKRTAKFAL